jgi:8-oxo-dGTP pyrophosphatase MutT (NUDIX family)
MATRFVVRGVGELFPRLVQELDMQQVSVTVAAVIQHQGRFLLVEEETEDGARINQPAGHLEPDESILEGAVRETLEESAYEFSPTGLVGVYHWRHPTKGVTYVRFALCGDLGRHHARRALDQGILRALWLAPHELRACAPSHRSPLVLRCVEDYLGGQRYPLGLLVHCT